MRSFDKCLADAVQAIDEIKESIETNLGKETADCIVSGSVGISLSTFLSKRSTNPLISGGVDSLSMQLCDAISIALEPLVSPDKRGDIVRFIDVISGRIVHSVAEFVRQNADR